MRAAVLSAVLLIPAAASAVMQPRSARRQSQRFEAGLLQPSATVSDETARRAVDSYNQQKDVGLGPASLLGHGRRAPSGPAQAAAAFLSQTQQIFGVDPAQLIVERQAGGAGVNHVLYKQTYKGVPVEFARVKVHVDPAGKIVSASSNFRPNLDLDVAPSVSPSVAAYAVRRDAGQEPRSGAALVVFPDPGGGQTRLAWKFTVHADGLWRYYVDAHSGELLFRYDDRRYGVCPVAQSSGTVQGEVYDLDPQNGALPALRPFAHQRVYIGNGDTFVDTDGDGFFCAPTAGKVFTQLQGPFVNVSNFRGPNASYDNGSGVWLTSSTPISSPHPYSNNSNLVSTITLVAANVVKFLPIFTSFKVGAFADDLTGEGGNITDDDQVSIIDSSGNVVASYIGDRGGFNGAAVAGKVMRIRLKSNETGVNTGFDVDRSSYLTLSSPGTVGPAAANTDGASGSFAWYPASHTNLGMRSEISLFYHLNRMHDYFAGDVNRSSYAVLTPVSAMAFVGPSLLNAFYDPDYDDLFFGDKSDAEPKDLFTDDATVVHHEYTHYVLDKIWPIQNFGQAGAISEAVADYFSASSLNHSAIGKAANEGLNGNGPLRELSCSDPGCKKLGVNQPWQGEIHLDSIFLSQALWQLRTARMSLQGDAAGQSCADNLVFQALLYFPESFNEFQNALNRADEIGSAPMCAINAPACLGAAEGCVARAGTIDDAFGRHGIQSIVGTNDPYDTAVRRNDGFESAVDISTLPPVSATIFPASDVDFYTFAAGPGPVDLTLDLPPDGFFYKGYTMMIFDRDRKLIAEASPPFDDGFGNDPPFCSEADCTTTHSTVKYSFVNALPGQYYIQVSGGPTFSGASNSGVASTTPYVLRASYMRPAAAVGSIVSAKFDGDVISFAVRVATFARVQDFSFANAQLVDHSGAAIPNTLTHVPASAGDMLLFVSSENAHGIVSGRVELAAGFDVRYPSVGTVKLEVFGYNVIGSTISLGQSQPLNLSTNQTEVKAWNNVFNPNLGQKTTIKFDVQTAGRLRMKLYTLSGTFIATVFDDTIPVGKGSVDWNGRNTGGMIVASGIYLLQVEGPGLSKTQKIAVVK